MYYFDFSATTKPSDESMNMFLRDADKICDNDTLSLEKEDLKRALNTSLDVIYTSGSTESNNLAIKGVLNKYKNQNKHIITTTLEHSSVNETLLYMKKFGFIIDYVKLNNGIVDIESLKELINCDTVLVSICSVNSETGLLQPIDKIKELLREYENVIFHCDMTQSIGKVNIDLNSIDLVTFNSHKIFGLKGIGVLLKDRNIELDKIIFGERIYNLGLIKSFNYTVSDAIKKIKENYIYVEKLKEEFINDLKGFDGITINSNSSYIPYIVNFSVDNIKPETFLHALEQYEIYVSTKSACSTNNDYSLSVLSLTNNIELAKTSLRVSLSIYNNCDEIHYVTSKIMECYNKLNLKGDKK